MRIMYPERRINPHHQVRFNNNISPHVTYEQATRVMFDVCNRPGVTQKRAMINLATRVYEPLIEQFGDIFDILSFYRSQALCSAMRKRMPNQHMAGEAMDFGVKEGHGLDNNDIFEWLYFNSEYDLLVWTCAFPEESHCSNLSPPWIHVSLKKVNNRHQAFRNYFDDKGMIRFKRIWR